MEIRGEAQGHKKIIGDDLYGERTRMFGISKSKQFSRLALLSFLFPVAFTLSCGQSTTDSAIDDANNALTSSNCASALTDILPVYNSSSSNNQVRLITASAYGCDAGVNFFQVLTNLGLDASTFNSAGLFGYLAQIFPSTTGDQVVASAGYGMEALMATLIDGQVVSPENSINSTSFNPGSTNYVDRTDDSNIYMPMIAMAAMGGAAARRANTSFHPTNASTPFPWIDNSTNMSVEGCTFVAAIENFFATLPSVLPSVTGDAATELRLIDGLFSQTVLDQACIYGCTGTTPGLPNWHSSGCSLSNCGNGSQCPAGIRDWNQCHPNVANDPVACAAAGIVNLINNSGAGVWQ